MTAQTVGSEVQHATETLTMVGCETPRADAEEIVAAVLGCDTAGLHLDGYVSGDDGRRIAEYVARRSAREPLAYITGRCRYRGLVLSVDCRVCVPHPQSGQLVNVALRLPAGARVHDVGTGAGNIALAIKNERPDLTVTGSDVSAEAVGVAHENAARLALDVAFMVADGVPPGDYDLIVADLPYGDDSGTLVPQSPENRHQPQVAHFGGARGHETIAAVVRRVRTGTAVAVQHAVGQTDEVRALLAEPDTFGDARFSARFTVGRVR
ncbi:methyltransferase [Streptosporangium sp. LJ11]|uniref:N5-glutamine methyltransferase family protein n=1 Tax=Streptosporangium sp. LJ11 TaxID=3436927 RepID=UPI003F7AA54F